MGHSPPLAVKKEEEEKTREMQEMDLERCTLNPFHF